MTKRKHLLVGVDSGGTKIDVLICNPQGAVLSFATGPGGIPRRVGHEAYIQKLDSVIKLALSHLDNTEYGKVEIELGIGLAGFDWPSQESDLLHLFRNMPHVIDVKIANDTIAALLAGSESGWGICVDAGTGCNCRGLDKNGRQFRVIGTGYMFAEYGSATDIAGKAIEAVGHEWTGKGPRTAITGALLQANGLKKLDILVERLSIGKITVAPEFARVVLKLASTGDRVALSIVAWAASELTELVGVVAKQFPPISEPMEIVAVGSLLSESSPIWSTFRKIIAETIPGAQVRSLALTAAIGGLLLTPTASRKHIRKTILSSFIAQKSLRRMA